MAKHNFRVGDEFEGSPIQLNHWVTPVWAAGGRVEFDGETATIVYLPEDLEEEDVAEVEVETPSPVEEIIPAPLPVEELEEVAIAPGPVEEVQVEIAEEPALVEEVQVEVAEKIEVPKISRGRPKKIVDPVDKVE